MTNAEQIALYEKQVEAIEEERTSLDDKADAIRAKIRALQPPMSTENQAMLEPILQMMFRKNALLVALADPWGARIGTSLQVLLPNDFTVRPEHG